MNLFDELVTEALKKQPSLSTLRMVVEKELLHHDILRILSQNNLLKDLTFIGGTCLRTCYGAIRLSEDLDFTGGKDFNRESLSNMGHTIKNSLKEKYGLDVLIKEPIKDINNVDTWKIKVETRPKQRHLPAQRINIDICKVPSYDKQPMLLLNPYGMEMGTAGLVIQAQSRQEIYSDKLVAFAMRPNRLKYRDLWDITWLHQQNIKPNFTFVSNKLKDRNIETEQFIELFEHRKEKLTEDKKLEHEFNQEMQRFLPVEQINKSIKNNNLWSFIVYLIVDLNSQLSSLKN